MVGEWVSGEAQEQRKIYSAELYEIHFGNNPHLPSVSVLSTVYLKIPSQRTEVFYRISFDQRKNWQPSTQVWCDVEKYFLQKKELVDAFSKAMRNLQKIILGEDNLSSSIALFDANVYQENYEKDAEHIYDFVQYRKLEHWDRKAEIDIHEYLSFLSDRGIPKYIYISESKLYLPYRIRMLQKYLRQSEAGLTSLEKSYLESFWQDFKRHYEKWQQRREVFSYLPEVERMILEEQFKGFFHIHDLSLR